MVKDFMAPQKIHWIRSNGFLIGLVLAVLLAFWLPGPGSKNGILHADILNNFGIALILLMQGVSLAFEKIKDGARHWRLHVCVQSFTFIIFPLVGLAFHFMMPLLWPSEPQAIREGFLYLCVLPSTVSTSVVLTAVAKGNTSGALFNAAFSNILGVLVTPLLVHFLMQSTGETGSFGPLLLKIVLLTLLPFTVGMILRNYVMDWVDLHKIWINRISNLVILIIVYTAFCNSVEERIWQTYGFGLTGLTAGYVLLLFGIMSLLIYLSTLALHFNREDAIAAYFCGVKKTLAMGVPLALVIFGSRSDISLILLPIMLYHPVQNGELGY